jgi:hypothetical protein
MVRTKLQSETVESLLIGRHQLNWLEFVAALIKTILSWPVVVLVIVIILHEPITNILTNFRTLDFTGWGQQLKITREVETLQAKAIEANLEAPSTKTAKAPPQDAGNPPPMGAVVGPQSQTSTVFVQQARGVADIDPNTAILFAWRGLEHVLEQIGEERKLAPMRAGSAMYIVRTLKEQHVIDDTLVALITQLQNIRNNAAQLQRPNQFQGIGALTAKKYIDITESVIQRIQQILG